MTISSLAKFIAGVNRMVVENVEIENPEINPTIIISVRPTKRDSCRCGIETGDRDRGRFSVSKIEPTADTSKKETENRPRPLKKWPHNNRSLPLSFVNR